MSESRLRFRHTVQVRFRDLDPMGHAHHSLPLIYFEEARAAYWREVAGRLTLDDIDYVLAEIRVQFQQRILFPGTLTVHTGVTHVGNASFTMEYELRDAEAALLATGSSVQVMYDYVKGKAKPIPEDLKKRIEAYER